MNSDSASLGDGGPRFVIAPDVFTNPAHRAAAAAFTAFVAAERPDAVAIVVAAGVEPVAAATAVEDLRAEYRGPVTLLYGAKVHSGLHRHGGWPATPAALAAGPLPITSGWRVLALNPGGHCRHRSAHATRLARTLDRLWTHAEAAAFLNISAWTLHHLCGTSAGPTVYRVGDHRRHDPAEVIRWLRTSAMPSKAAGDSR